MTDVAQTGFKVRLPLCMDLCSRRHDRVNTFGLPTSARRRSPSRLAYKGYTSAIISSFSQLCQCSTLRWRFCQGCCWKTGSSDWLLDTTIIHCKVDLYRIISSLLFVNPVIKDIKVVVRSVLVFVSRAGPGRLLRWWIQFLLPIWKTLIGWLEWKIWITLVQRENKNLTVQQLIESWRHSTEKMSDSTTC